MSGTGESYDNPAVIDLSDGTEVSNRDSYPWPHWPGDRRRSRINTCNCPSPLNNIAFVMLIASGTLCAIGSICPFWIYYPLRWGVPVLEEFKTVYPFKQAKWRGLWAICYLKPDLNPRIVDSYTPDRCFWFGQDDNNAWETIPGWYNAAQVLFTVGLVMLFLAAVAQTAFACCHCGLKRAWVPTLVASLTLVAGIMCTASLALFGDSSFTEGELTPEPTGQEGRLDWAFSVSIAGAVCTIVTSLMFYGDAVRMAWTNKSCR